MMQIGRRREHTKGQINSMVPAEFISFFATMAGVGATLFGLIFLVISIKPVTVNAENPAVMQQVQIASSYTALLNPLAISLIALLPHETIDGITITMSAIGLVNTVLMAISLLRDPVSWIKKLRRALFSLGSLVVFSFEIVYGIRLLITPGDLATLHNLCILLVIIYLYGVARAWDLVGARQFHIFEALTPFVPKRMEEFILKHIMLKARRMASRWEADTFMESVCLP